jgi:hypothetical protein
MPGGIKVIIDYSDLAEELGMTKKQLNSMHKFVASRMARGYANVLKKVAQSELKSLKTDYTSAIKTDGDIVYLSSDIANKIEEGGEPYDLKKSDFQNKKQTKDGKSWYVDIPFRHSSPRSLGRGLGFASSIPTEVYSALQTKIKQGGAERLNKKDLPSNYANTITKAAVKGYGSYTHKQPIYEGLLRTGSSFQRRYYTFRRISPKSDPNSWIHPGMNPKNLMDKALAQYNTDEEADKFIDEFLNRI